VTPRAREHRFRRLYEIGCLACFDEGMPGAPAQIHHLNLGGRAGQKQLGDECTIPICPWHHQGHVHAGQTISSMTLQYGPSLAHQSKAFRAKYGTDTKLLARANDMIRQLDEIAA
jgi:hypothetical protein